MNQPEINSSAIAVVGMAGRFPGAQSLDQFWENLREGRESIKDLTDADLEAAGVDQSITQDEHYVKRAAVLEGIDQFDADFFGFSPRDAAIMDPQHRLFLECSWEALENAGWDSSQFPGSIGVYAGSGMSSYLIHNLLPNRKVMETSGLFLIKQTGNDKDVLATRVSYQLDLNGPSMSVQTACSTSLVAIHLACQSLLGQECDMALAGGVTIEIPHGCGYLYRPGEILSRDGRCRPFAADSSGTVFSSGLGVVVLRRLENAIQDGDRIHAVILGTAVNNDGARKAGFFAPSVVGQSEVVRQALAVAGIEPESVAYVETHGTGTAVGDPIEITALTKAFQSTGAKRTCAIGSLKSNVGHLDAAAGVAGFIKTVLALERRQIPPSLHFTKPNPLIDFENSPFYVNAQLSEWKSLKGSRRAGVTSLGIGGTNAHVILEEAPPTASSHSQRSPQLLTLSAKTEAALVRALQRMADHLQNDPDVNLADVAFTCHRGRRAFTHRWAAVCGSVAEAVQALRNENGRNVVSGAAPSRSSLAFLFPGQGTQYAGMTSDLYAGERVFSGEVDRCSELLRPHIGIDIRTLLYPTESGREEATKLLNQTRFTQPALFVVELALAKLWSAWGIRPDCMIGHSIGELVAATIAQVFSLEDALSIVALRAQLMQSMSPGGMLAANLPESEAAAWLPAEVSLAAVNAPDQCVFSGPETAIDDLAQRLRRADKSAQRLQTSHAFHSASADSILQPFVEFVGHCRLRPPQIPFVSNFTGDWIKPEHAIDPGYWAKQIRSTVQFSNGIRQVIERGAGAFLEVGPGQVLSGLTKRHVSKNDFGKVFSSVRGPRESVNDQQLLLTTLGRLWAVGADVNWTEFHQGDKCHPVLLPTYPFERQRFWIEAPAEVQLAKAVPEVVEKTKNKELVFFQPVWRKAVESPSHLTQVDTTGWWLIFSDPLGLGDCLAGELRAREVDTVSVAYGSEFGVLNRNAFRVDPASRSDFDLLLRHCLEDRGAPRGIIYLWPIYEPTSSRSTLDGEGSFQERCFHSLVFLAQAIGAQDINEPIELTVVSNDLHSVGGEEILSAERAVLMGPIKVIPREYPRINARWIDVQSQEAASGRSGLLRLAQQILAEQSQDNNDTIIAYRQGERWVSAIESVQLAPRSDLQRIKRDGVYLITGGLGGIGYAVSEFLARKKGARIALVDRTGLPARADWESLLLTAAEPLQERIRKVKQLEKMGAEVIALRGDVTLLDDMHQAVSSILNRWGTIDGVFHCAGTIHDEVIQLKERDRAESVLAPKVKGTLNLNAALSGIDLDFFLLFSSISSLIAPVGQVDYAAANAFEDAFSQMMHSLGRKNVMAINWGRWRDVGLAATNKVQPGSDSTGQRPPNWLAGRCVRANDQEVCYEQELSFERHWVLNEHRFHGAEALLPGTGYIEIARVLASKHFRAGGFELRNLSFAAPLMVDFGKTRAIQSRIFKTGDEWRFSVSAARRQEGKSPTTECVSATLHFPEETSPERFPLDETLRRCSRSTLTFSSDVQNTKQAKFLYFGPRWRSLRRIHFGERELISFSELPEEFTSDLESVGLHPALLDVATGSAMFAISGYEKTEDLYVPILYQRLRVYGALPRHCYAHITWTTDNNIQDEIVTFDLTLLDERGAVLATANEFVLRRVTDIAMFYHEGTETDFDRQRPIPVSFESKTDEEETAITTDQGIVALERLLEAGLRPQLIVAPASLQLERAVAPGQRKSTPRHNPEPLVGGDEIAPGDDIERTLVSWWSDLLGVEQVGARDDFFDLGGHSLIAVRLFTKIKKGFGLDLGVGTLFEARTIESLSRLIRGGHAVASQCIVPIHSAGSKSPLFFLHAVNGEILLYRHIVRHLEPTQPVFGVRAAQIDKNPEAVSSMEELAALYVEEILRVQPAGPYNLAGYSYGGFLAFEVARQLKLTGKEISLLAILDSVTSELNIRWSFREKMAQRATRIRYRFSILKSRGWKDWVSYLRWRAHLAKEKILEKRNGSRPEYIEWVEPEHQHVATVLRKLSSEWEPKPFAGAATLLRARDRSKTIEFDPQNGWGKLISQLAICEFDGDHVSFIREPGAEDVARKLTGLLSCQTGAQPPIQEHIVFRKAGP